VTVSGVARMLVDRSNVLNAVRGLNFRVRAVKYQCELENLLFHGSSEVVRTGLTRAPYGGP